MPFTHSKIQLSAVSFITPEGHPSAELHTALITQEAIFSDFLAIFNTILGFLGYFYITWRTSRNVTYFVSTEINRIFKKHKFPTPVTTYAHTSTHYPFLPVGTNN